MATILFAWELGGGLGHLTVIKPLAEALRDQGHRVVIAVRNFAWLSKVFERQECPFCELHLHDCPVAGQALAFSTLEKFHGEDAAGCRERAGLSLIHI